MAMIGWIRLGLLAGVAALLAMAAPADARPRPAHVAAAAWRLDEAGAHYGFSVSARHGPHGQLTGLSSPAATPASAIGTATRSVDARAWRAKAGTLSARVRLVRGAWAGVSLRVRAGDPERTGMDVDSHDAQEGAAIRAAGRWHVVRLNGRVAGDANRIILGLAGAGPMTAEFEAVRLSARAPDARPMAPEAAAYLQTALDFIHENHVNAAHNPDWPGLAAQARPGRVGAAGRSARA